MIRLHVSVPGMEAAHAAEYSISPIVFYLVLPMLPVSKLVWCTCMWSFMCDQENAHSGVLFLAVDDLSRHPIFGKSMCAHIQVNAHMCVLRKAVIEHLLQLQIIRTTFVYTVVKNPMCVLCRYECTEVLRCFTFH